MKRLLTRKNALLLLVAIVGFIYQTYFPDEAQLQQQQTITTSAIEIPPDRAKHILYGDHSGGGHKYGVGKPCKSEFPQSWDDNKIIGTIKKIAANENTDWQKDGYYYVTETNVENLRIRVVLNKKTNQIITAYPKNRPRNPCPANDN